MLDLAHASVLSSMTMSLSALDLPIRLSTLLRIVLPTRPSDARPLDNLTVVLEKGKSTLAVRDAWRALWPVLLGLITSVEQPYKYIVLRLQPPLTWDEHLVAGVTPLREALPVRLEYVTFEGEICAYDKS